MTSIRKEPVAGMAAGSFNLHRCSEVRSLLQPSRVAD